MIVHFGTAAAGKYLTFILNREEFAVDILRVQEIIQMQKATPIPGSPIFLDGVINLRGQLIPVLNLRATFEMPAAESMDEACIVIVQFDEGSELNKAGLVVDEVSEVSVILKEQIEAPPVIARNPSDRFLIGMAKSSDSVKMLVDINRLLSVEEQQAMAVRLSVEAPRCPSNAPIAAH